MTTWLTRPTIPAWLYIIIYSTMLLVAFYAGRVRPQPQPAIHALPAKAVFWMDTNPGVVCAIPSWVCTDGGPVRRPWVNQPLYFPPNVSFEEPYD